MTCRSAGRTRQVEIAGHGRNSEFGLDEIGFHKPELVIFDMEFNAGDGRRVAVEASTMLLYLKGTT